MEFIRGLRKKGRKVFRYILSLRIPVYAAYAGFFMVLSVFPTLALLLGLVRYTGLEIHNLTQLLSGVIPEALMPVAQKLILSTYYSSPLLSLSAVTALWSASRGIQGLRTGLNTVYGVTEDRGYFHTRLISMVYTVLFLLVLLLTLGLHVFGTSLARFLPPEMTGLRFLLLLGAQTLLFTGMYTVLPNRRNRFAASLPGGLLASCGWLLLSASVMV